MKYTNTEIANIIESFLDGTIDEHGWDDFTSCPIKESAYEAIRLECIQIQDDYPATIQGWYCSPEGMMRLREIASILHATLPNPPKR